MRPILLLFCAFITIDLSAQYILDTPDGKRVKLNANGTWEFMKSDIRSRPVFIPKKSTAKYVSKYTKYVIWYDPTEWICDTMSKGPAWNWDVTFNSYDYAITGYFMYSRLSIAVNSIQNVVREQWKNSGEIKSFNSFKDTINSIPITGFDMELDYNGIFYKYRGYMYSTPVGSFQFTIGTQKELFDEDHEKIEQLLKGIVPFKK